MEYGWYREGLPVVLGVALSADNLARNNFEELLHCGESDEADVAVGVAAEELERVVRVDGLLGQVFIHQVTVVRHELHSSYKQINN